MQENSKSARRRKSQVASRVLPRWPRGQDDAEPSGVASRLPQKKTINATQFEFSRYPEAIESVSSDTQRPL